MAMNTVALEFVPPDVDDGHQRAAEEAQKILELSSECGIAGRIGHLMIPGMIAEDPDRPVEMKPKMDPLEVWRAAGPVLGGVRGLCTQVTAFLDRDSLTERLNTLRQAGIEGIIFVGVPRTMADGEGGGVPPTDALAEFQQVVPHRGVILIPTREGELGRFGFKCERGASFALTQLLYSDAIIDFLKQFAAQSDHRPEVLLSLGYVPQVEQKIGLIRWLIQDPGNPVVEKEQAFIASLTQMPTEQRQQQLLDLYKRIIDGVADLGFPLSLHFETPYGFVRPAFQTLARMLEYWSPDRPHT